MGPNELLLCRVEGVGSSWSPDGESNTRSESSTVCARAHDSVSKSLKRFATSAGMLSVFISTARHAGLEYSYRRRSPPETKRVHPIGRPRSQPPALLCIVSLPRNTETARVLLGDVYLDLLRRGFSHIDRQNAVSGRASYLEAPGTLNFKHIKPYTCAKLCF